MRDMREILFRGKRVDNGEWVEGYYFPKYDITLPGLSKTFILNQNEVGDVLWIEVDPSTVGQYTGLTDKNGVKIFEGDIVQISLPIQGCKPIEGVSEVYFDNGCFCVNWGGNYRPHYRTRIDSFVPDTVFEVIGNIHDNPELLKGGAGE